MRRVAHEIQERLESSLKTKLLTLLSQKGAVAEEIELLEKMTLEVHEQIETSSQSSLVMKANDLMELLIEAQEKHTVANTAAPRVREPVYSVMTYPFEQSVVPAHFVSELVPDYSGSTFVIEHFANVKSSVEVMYSAPLVIHGLSWRLKVYPNGTGIAKGIFLSVFVEMWKGLKEAMRYEYKVEMVNHKNPANNVIREFSSMFELGECWGYNRFYRYIFLFILSPMTYQIGSDWKGKFFGARKQWSFGSQFLCETNIIL